MYEIVKYHNDLNRVKIPLLSEQEHNLFMLILTLIKDAMEADDTNKDGSFISLNLETIKNFINKNLTYREFNEIIDTFKNKIFKSDFTMLVKDGDLIGKMTIHLFEYFVVWHRSDNGFTGFERMDIKISPYFSYLIDRLNANFTRFELTEFLEIRGQYSKTLYRLLKQFRNTGKMITFNNRWDDFCEIMGIPKDYLPHHIDQRVLKPAIKELSSKKDNPIFKNLTYKKIKDFRQKGKIVGIEFYFTPRKIKEEQDIQPIKKLKKFAVTERIYFDTEAEKIEYLRNKNKEKAINKVS